MGPLWPRCGALRVSCSMRCLVAPNNTHIRPSTGPHKCIGYKLAMLEAVLCLVALSRTFVFSHPTPHHAPPSLKMGVTLVPKHGVPLAVRLRQTPT